VVLRKCDDLPAEVTGAVLLLAPVMCQEMKNVTVSDTAAFNSLGLGESGRLIFHNVRFAIASNASALFGGVTLHFGRDE
ncbi:unnamed protein product, partial [Sphacelaria rigidula]